MSEYRRPELAALGPRGRGEGGEREGEERKGRERKGEKSLRKGTAGGRHREGTRGRDGKAARQEREEGGSGTREERRGKRKGKRKERGQDGREERAARRKSSLTTAPSRENVSPPSPPPKCTPGEARLRRGSQAGTELPAGRRRLGRWGRAGSERGGGGAGGARNGLQNHICFSCDFIKSHSSSPECVKISTFHSDTPH